MMPQLPGQRRASTAWSESSSGLPGEQVEACEGDDMLPLVYNPEQIAAFWARRPVAVFQRIVQLLSIAGGFLSSFLLDLAAGKLAENEVDPPAVRSFALHAHDQSLPSRPCAAAGHEQGG